MPIIRPSLRGGRKADAAIHAALPGGTAHWIATSLTLLAMTLQGRPRG